jgi:hypothetical protein
MELAHYYQAERDYWEELRRTNERHSQQRWQLFLKRWENERQKEAEQRRIENTKKEFEATSPLRLREAEEQHRARTKIDLEKAVEAEKLKPWDAAHDPYSRAVRDYSAQKAATAMAGKEILKDPLFSPYNASAFSGIMSGLMDKNTKDPEALEVRRIMEQYATPDEHDWLRKGVVQSKIHGDTLPIDRLIRDIYIMRNQGNPDKLVMQDGQWARPSDMEEVAGGWLTKAWKRLPAGYQGPRASLSDLSPVQQQAAQEQEPAAKIPKSAAQEEAAIYADARKNLHKYVKPWSSEQTYFLQMPGGASNLVNPEALFKEPTRAGHEGWLNAIKEAAVERAQAETLPPNGVVIPAGWHKGANTNTYYNDAGETYNPRLRSGEMSAESMQDWNRWRPVVGRADVPRDNPVAEYVKGEPPIKPVEREAEAGPRQSQPDMLAAAEMPREVVTDWDTAPPQLQGMNWREELDELKRKLFGGGERQHWLDTFTGMI